MITKRFPERISIGGITLKKVSANNENDVHKELLHLYKINRNHLFYWHHEIKELLFNSTADIINHIRKYRLICYAVYYCTKISGYIEITKPERDEDDKKCRTLSFWVDKDNVRKGIMYACLKALEKHFIAQGTDVLCADTDADNISSISLLEKSGYKKYMASFLVPSDGKTLCSVCSLQKTIIKRKAV